MCNAAVFITRFINGLIIIYSIFMTMRGSGYFTKYPCIKTLGETFAKEGFNSIFRVSIFNVR